MCAGLAIAQAPRFLRDNKRSMIRIGTAGWKYKDWNGIVYPKPKPRGFDELAWLARYFTAVEINSSYYGAPRPSAAKKWVESVAANPAFRFTAKLFHSFTHERKPAPNDEKDFKDGIAPLVEAGRFGALLLQFPWSFRNSRENREVLTALHRQFCEYPLVVEVRHASWTDPAILDLLGDLDMGVCNIDQPLFKRSIRPSGEATSAVGYIRLHGRNYKTWFAESATVRERYDYLYSVAELEPWVDRVREVADKTSDVYVTTNNHNLGKAAVNALQITSILQSAPVPAPPVLVEHYPDLQPYVGQKA
jgi:uncharacterized protein YecE (DUF72 family)